MLASFPLVSRCLLVRAHRGGLGRGCLGKTHDFAELAVFSYQSCCGPSPNQPRLYQPYASSCEEALGPPLAPYICLYLGFY